MEDTLDDGPSVSDSNWWVISISQQIINEFPGMWARSASCLKNERDKDLKQNVLASMQKEDTADWGMTHGQPRKV